MVVIDNRYQVESAKRKAGSLGGLIIEGRGLASSVLDNEIGQGLDLRIRKKAKLIAELR